MPAGRSAFCLALPSWGQRRPRNEPRAAAGAQRQLRPGAIGTTSRSWAAAPAQPRPQVWWHRSWPRRVSRDQTAATGRNPSLRFRFFVHLFFFFFFFKRAFLPKASRRSRVYSCEKCNKYLAFAKKTTKPNQNPKPTQGRSLGIRCLQWGRLGGESEFGHGEPTSPPQPCPGAGLGRIRAFLQ